MLRCTCFISGRLTVGNRVNRKGETGADALHASLAAQRQKVPPGSATAKAIDYTLGNWQALTRYIDQGDLPAENNCVENQIRPVAIGRTTGCLSAASARPNALRQP
jgi:hypothetical protein